MIEDALQQQAEGHSILHSQNFDKLGVGSLAIMVFYTVSGGPFGVEECVRSAGNLLTLLGFLIFPLVWSVPEAAMTAELGSTFPEAAGGAAWVEEAFSSAFLGWMSGFFTWASGVTDNAIYPVLFLEYLLQAVGHNNEAGESSLNPVLRLMAITITTILLSYVNWLGLNLVGKMSVIICCFAMSPFLVLCIVGVFKIQPSRWLQLPQADTTAGEDTNSSHGGVLWRPFLNCLFWNLNSFDSTANFAADARDPHHVFPRALFIGLTLVVSGYLVPLLVATGASNAPQHAWVDGYLARVSRDVVGPWLGGWTVLAAGISNVALFQAEFSSDALQILGMAERGYLPKVFAHRSRHGTPTGGIVLGGAILVLMGLLNVEALIEMLNFLYCVSLLMEYCAFLTLRIRRPNLERPWRVPLGTPGCALALFPAVCMTFLIMSLASWQTYIVAVGVTTVGVLIFNAKKASCSIHYYVQLNNKRNGSDEVDISTNSNVIQPTDTHTYTIRIVPTPDVRAVHLPCA